MSLRDEFDLRMKEVLAPAVRSAGFKGSGRNFSLKNELGDVAFLNIQGSSWSSADDLVFYVNVAVVPYPWWHSGVDGWEKKPAKPDYSFGLFRNRLERERGQWAVVDARSTRKVIDDLTTRVTQPDGLPLLSALLNREAMKERVRSGDLGFIKRVNGWDAHFDGALAILLADEGPSGELDEAIARLQAQADESDPHGASRRQLDWVDARRTRAAD